MRFISHLGLAIGLTNVVFGQALTQRPSFEIADVHASPRSTWVKKNDPKYQVQGGWLNGDRYQVRRATLLDLIKLAYGVDADKIYGGPNWLDYDRFEVIGKAPPGTRAENLRWMLQSLLADRFKLVVKTETKPMPAYVLTATKGRAKLKAADGSGTSGCAPRSNPTAAAIECRNVTMDLFVAELRRFYGYRLNDLPVANQTGIDGTWDLTAQFAAMWNGIKRPGMSVEEALDKQLGLTLKLGTAPQPALTVESARQPTANPAGVAKALPPPPAPEFEVASLRPCPSGVVGSGGSLLPPRFEAGGRVTAQCYPLMLLIRQVWNLPYSEPIVGLPKWLAEGSLPSVTITAKAPAGNFMGTQGAQDNDALNAMLRHLLVDRYKMKVHFENRPMDALTLVAGKPKLTKADPSRRTGCTYQSRDMPGTPDVTYTVVCQNITLAQFAEQMPGFDSAIYHPVLDATGIQGAWDFTLNWSKRMTFGAPPKDADPSGGGSLSGAINKQLGLKVVTSKRPQPVLVIDHMENTPAEN